MNIQKFVNTPLNGASFHSNGFADAASGSNTIGIGPQSFGQRSRIDRTRRAVRRYGDSMIARGHMKETARVELERTNPLRQPGARAPLNASGNMRPSAIPNIPPRTFNEPRPRGFTPFS